MIPTSDSANANNFKRGSKPSALLTLTALRIGLPGQLLGSAAPSQQHVITLLNASLATELVCVLRYKRNHFMAAAMGLEEMAEQYLLHSDEEMTHAELLAQRIVELGGKPDFSPASLNYNGHARYDDAHDLMSMTRSHLVAEHAAIETYAQIIDVLSGSDPVTQKLIESIVLVELDHAGSINDWLGQVGTGRGNAQHGPALLHSPCTVVPNWEGDRP